MKLHTASCLLSSALLLSTACGGAEGPREGASVGSKGQAAEAAYGVVDTKQGLEQSSTGRGLIPAQLVTAEGVEGTNRFEVEGQSGRAIVEASASVTSGNVRHTYEVTFEAFSWDGVDFYDGSVRYEGEVSTDGNGATVREHVVGRCETWGRYKTTLDMDVTIEVIADASGVRLRIDGRIEADGERFDYSDSDVVIGSDGRISVDGQVEVDDGNVIVDDNNNDNNDNNDDARCRGTYSGSYQGDAVGVVEAELDGDLFRLTFISDLAGSPITYTFPVDGEGRIAGMSFDLTVDADLDFDTCAIAGTWRNAAGSVGTWQSRRD